MACIIKTQYTYIARINCICFILLSDMRIMKITVKVIVTAALEKLYVAI